MRLIVSRPAASFFRPDRQYIQCAEHNIFAPRVTDAATNNRALDRVAWLLARGGDVAAATSQPHGRAACAVAIGKSRHFAAVQKSSLSAQKRTLAALSVISTWSGSGLQRNKEKRNRQRSISPRRDNQAVS
jgi:hypothetical protein